MPIAAHSTRDGDVGREEEAPLTKVMMPHDPHDHEGGNPDRDDGLLDALVPLVRLPRAFPLRRWSGGRAPTAARAGPAGAQPMPIHLRYITTVVEGGPVTAIGRTWAPGDAARCRLCPRDECRVDGGGSCLVQVAGRVEPRDAALFSLAAWRAGLKGVALRAEVPGDGDAPGADGGAGRGA